MQLAVAGEAIVYYEQLESILRTTAPLQELDFLLEQPDGQRLCVSAAPWVRGKSKGEMDAAVAGGTKFVNCFAPRSHYQQVIPCRVDGGSPRAS